MKRNFYMRKMCKKRPGGLRKMMKNGWTLAFVCTTGNADRWANRFLACYRMPGEPHRHVAHQSIPPSPRTKHLHGTSSSVNSANPVRSGRHEAAPNCTGAHEKCAYDVKRSANQKIMHVRLEPSCASNRGQCVSSAGMWN